MEFLYNPDSMSEAEIKATFVARQHLVDELVSLVERQPDGAGVQHVLIIAPRGMGKTTVLLMVKFGIKDRGLSDGWQAVKFPEESYGIYDLSDFWLQVLEVISSDTNDAALGHRARELKAEYPDNEDLQEAALALIKDWRRKHKKRLALLVDNFDMILEQINDERDNARLRDVLMNDGTMMVIGCAVSFFHEAHGYDQPLYNFFKVYDLANLKFEQMQELLRRRAEHDRREGFEEKLKENAGRLRVLEYFTGGNPRLVLMLYRVVTQSDLSEVQRGLEKLLDEVTPYFKAKIESLPPQQRKILDHIARVSSKTNEGLTPTEIAAAARLTPNQVSAQLKRLSELGYVRAANLRGRSSFYALSEPLYAIWHQMRFGRDARERMQWLINFLKVWYDAQEMGPESMRLEVRFREHLTAGRMREARDALAHRYYLAEAMDDSSARASTLDGVVRGYIELNDTDTLKKNVLNSISLEILSDENLDGLLNLNCITEEAACRAKALAAVKLGIELGELGQAKEALQHFDRAVRMNPESVDAWYNRGVALDNLGRYEEAVASYDRALDVKPNYNSAWYNRGVALMTLGMDEDAIVSYDRALEIKPDDEDAWNNRGNILHKLGNYEEAVASYDRALKVRPKDRDVWFNRMLLYLAKSTHPLGQGEDSLAREDWREALSSLGHIEKEKWYKVASIYLTNAALAGHVKLARELIAESNLEKPLFPLARAIDYFLTGDEALIERLSPEVRGIVEETAAQLRESIGHAKKEVSQSHKARKSGEAGKARGRKSTSTTRSRTKKQLR